jgi:uncharacterized protein (DUF4415 family)
MKKDAAHDENPEWTDADFKRAVPASGLPKSLQGKLRGRPKAAVTKEAVKLRLDPDVGRAARHRPGPADPRQRDAAGAVRAVGGLSPRPRRWRS